MKILPWLSKAIVLLAIALLIYFPIEVVLLLQQHQWPEPNTPVFFKYLLLSSVYILALALSIWLIYHKQFAWLGVYLYLFIPVLFFVQVQDGVLHKPGSKPILSIVYGLKVTTVRLYGFL